MLRKRKTQPQLKQRGCTRCPRSARRQTDEHEELGAQGGGTGRPATTRAPAPGPPPRRPAQLTWMPFS